MSETAPPEPDRREGVPHPRDALHLFGQEEAEEEAARALAGARMHHAWLLTGPEGVGKATFAWRFAAAILSAPHGEAQAGLFAPAEAGAGDTPAAAARLEIDPEGPLARRIRAGAEPRLFCLRRGWDEKAKRHRAEITVDEVRKLKGFFGLSAADGGRRVVIVDPADALNRNAANALLKLLEEPPAGAVLLLVSHQPGRLLPTIRSRCRTLRFAPLAPGGLAAALAQAGIDLPGEPGALDALAALGEGSAGRAAGLLALDGLEIYAGLTRLLASLPELDRPAAIALAESVAGRGAEARLDLLVALIELWLARVARTGLAGPPSPEAAAGEAALAARLCPDAFAARAWADHAATALARLRHGRAVNLDPSALILDTLLATQATAARLAAA